jgi:hypothetical protein
MKHIKLFFFFLMGFTFHANCQTMMTVGEVYDFSVNDEFHYKTLSVPPNAVRIKITEKYFSINTDTVYYVFTFDNYSTAVDMSTNPPHLDYTFESGTDTMQYAMLDSMINTLYQFPTDSTVGNYFNDTLYYYNAYCDVPVYEYDGCIGCIFEGHFTNEIFGKGLGRVFIHDYVTPLDVTYQMSYFKKDSIECGTPDSTTMSISESANIKSRISIYPNPAKDFITIEGSDIFWLEILNSSGEMVMKRNYYNGKINISSLPAGLYLLRSFKSNGEVLGNTKVIKQ